MIDKIKSYIEPRSLYRYRSLQDLWHDRPLARLEREIDAIEHNYVYCSDFDRLNDPMEGVFSISKSYRVREAYEQIRRRKLRIGICSFSETNNNELMWAHYASQFSGICVSYDFARLCKQLPPKVEFVRMFYNEKEPRLRKFTSDFDGDAKMIFSSKNYRWLYEREWRMLAKTGRVNYKDRRCIRTVYLGFRVSPEARAIIESRLGNLDIKIRYMKLRKYSMPFDRENTSSDDS
jgi:hypothetical protein